MAVHEIGNFHSEVSFLPQILKQLPVGGVSQAAEMSDDPVGPYWKRVAMCILSKITFMLLRSEHLVLMTCWPAPFGSFMPLIKS